MQSQDLPHWSTVHYGARDIAYYSEDRAFTASIERSGDCVVLLGGLRASAEAWKEFHQKLAIASDVSYVAGDRARHYWLQFNQQYLVFRQQDQCTSEPILDFSGLMDAVFRDGWIRLIASYMIDQNATIIDGKYLLERLQEIHLADVFTSVQE